MAVESKLIIFVLTYSMKTYILLRKNTLLTAKRLIMLFMLFLSVNVSAQRPYGNEWIHFDQPYWKIKVAQDGVYRLNYAALKAGGVDVDGIKPNLLQLFYRGQQVPIFIKGEADSTFNSDDFIEFYGRRNDGALDSLLYANPRDQSHTFYSTYSDTSVYFLTFGYHDEPLRLKGYNYQASAGAVNTITEQKLTFFNEVYQDGAQIIPIDNYYTSEYTLNEGWQSTDIARGRERDVVIQTENADNTSSEKPVLEFRINSRSDVWESRVKDVMEDHHLIVSVKSNTGTFREVYNVKYNGFKANIASIPLEWSDLGSNITVRVRSNGIGTYADIHTIAYIRVKYPKKLALSAQVNRTFEHTSTSSDTAVTFNFSKPKTFDPSTIILFDVTNGFRSNPRVNTNGDTVSYTIKTAGNTAQYLLYATAQVNESLTVSPANFNQLDLFEDYNFLLVTHKVFRSAAQQFAEYKETRRMDSTGNYKVLTAYVDELYDQFFYGLKHPAAIQNFSAYVYNKQASKPKYLFLLGKGQEIRNVRKFNNARSADSADFVPSIGLPASELLFVSGIDNGFTGFDVTLYPNIAVGRLAARNEEEVLVYLDKLKAYDSVPPALWKKEIIHVGGGKEKSLQELSKFYLNTVKNIAEGPFMGAKVHSYFAETADDINTDKKATIQRKIESGIGLLTYFGHASGIQLGVEFADPKTLTNHNKYPILYLNGCVVGNPSLPHDVQADYYLFGKDKGAISWLSHSNATYTGTLFDQMRKFYTNMSRNTYNGTVGDAWSEALKMATGNVEIRAAAFSWTIQGDPSVNFPQLPLPDYTFAGNVLMQPEDVVATATNFDLAIPVGNLGKTDTQQIAISVKHTFPDGTSEVYDKMMIDPVFFADTILFNIQNTGKRLQGMNKFEIYLDADSAVAEFNEGNNGIEFEFYFPGTGVRSLFPLNYGIVANQQPELVAQSRDIFDTVTSMIFEIDTIHYFNSPFKQNSGVVNGHNILKWQPSLLAADSTVYYWRVRLNLPADSGGYWETRSFTYINGSGEGWSQSHFPQYAGIEGVDVQVDTTNRNFKYMPFFSVYQLFANPFWDGAIKPEEDLGMTCGISKSRETLVFIEFDKNTLAPQGTPVSRCASNTYWKGFKMTTPEGRAAFVDSVSKIKNGNYVGLISVGAYQGFKDWEPAVYEAFAKLGSEMMPTLTRDFTSFVIAGIKQDIKGTLIEEMSARDTSSIGGEENEASFIRITFEGTNNTSGSITSEPIGKAGKWKTVYASFDALETNSADDFYLQIIGMNANGTDTVLVDSITTYSYDLSGIDAKTYPMIRLRAFISDTVTVTAPQLSNWTVLFDGLPEGTLLVDNEYAFGSEITQQGDDLHLKLKYQNIYIHPFQEMLVSYQVFDASNKLVKTEYDTFPALQPGEHFYIDRNLATDDLNGNYRLSVVVNPGFAQPEQILDNNIFNRNFRVISDIANPLLDVTFDQRHIRNGEIVSANVVINIQAMDDNPTLLLNDTAQFDVRLITANGDTQKVHFNSPNVNFVGGTAVNNTADITFKPGPLQDGIYQLLVQVKDGSGNKSGMQPFTISFRVVNKAALSNFYVYPNPVSSRAKFVFTITGDKVPAIHGIEVYNLTGQLVSLIPLQNKIHVGVNEVLWDGTNGRGAKLTNGMYFYRVNMDGELPQHLLPEDRQMHEGYGKLIIFHE